MDLVPQRCRTTTYCRLERPVRIAGMNAIEKLKKVSTATLTTVLFKRGFRNVFIQGIFLLNKDAPRMVGPAYTLRYIPAREDLDQLGAFEGRGHPQREAIEACPPGAVLVMDARRDATAATGGDILMTRLHVRGVAGDRKS